MRANVMTTACLLKSTEILFGVLLEMRGFATSKLGSERLKIYYDEELEQCQLAIEKN